MVWGEAYKDNRGHYDLITVGGIDFIMIIWAGELEMRKFNG